MLHAAPCLQDTAEAADGSRFYALLVEVLKVEVNVLLNDVLRPTADAKAAVAPAADADATGSAEPPAASGSTGPSFGRDAPLAAHSAPSDMDVDGAGPSQPAEAVAGSAEVADGVAPQLQPRQPWTPEQQAERWQAAERAAAAAAGSGASTQQARLAVSEPHCKLLDRPMSDEVTLLPAQKKQTSLHDPARILVPDG